MTNYGWCVSGIAFKLSVGIAGLPQKRVWLRRRLHRFGSVRNGCLDAGHHRGDIAMEAALDCFTVHLVEAFVECDRSSDQLIQLRHRKLKAAARCVVSCSTTLTKSRRQLIDGTGLGAPDITGEFEVRAHSLSRASSSFSIFSLYEYLVSSKVAS
eukprot:6397268-Amphidinium_carterae.1